MELLNDENKLQVYEKKLKSKNKIFENEQHRKLYHYSQKPECIEQHNSFNPHLEAYETSQHVTTTWRI